MLKCGPWLAKSPVKSVLAGGAEYIVFQTDPRVTGTGTPTRRDNRER